MSRTYDRSAATRTSPRRGNRPAGFERLPKPASGADGAATRDNRMATPPDGTLGIPSILGRRARWVGARLRHRG